MVKFGGNQQGVGGVRDGMRVERQSQDRISTKIDVIEDTVRDHMRRTLIPMVKEHTRISIKGDPVEFYLYRRRRFGRRCSCWSDIEAGPEGQCPICYKTGRVPGYFKHGTEWVCLDVTAPALTMVNVEAAWDAGRRPVYFRLSDDAVRGFLLWKFQVKPNVGEADLIDFQARVPEGAQVKVYLKNDNASPSEYEELTSKELFTEILESATAGDTISVKVFLGRSHTRFNCPAFLSLHLRYKTKTKLTIIADIPPDGLRKMQSSVGSEETLDAVEINLTNEIRDVKPIDTFLIRARDGKRWVVQRTTDRIMGEQLIGRTTSIRLAYEWESYGIVL